MGWVHIQQFRRRRTRNSESTPHIALIQDRQSPSRIPILRRADSATSPECLRYTGISHVSLVAFIHGPPLERHTLGLNQRPAFLSSLPIFLCLSWFYINNIEGSQFSKLLILRKHTNRRSIDISLGIDTICQNYNTGLNWRKHDIICLCPYLRSRFPELGFIYGSLRTGL